MIELLSFCDSEATLKEETLARGEVVAGNMVNVLRDSPGASHSFLFCTHLAVGNI